MGIQKKINVFKKINLIRNAKIRSTQVVMNCPVTIFD